MKLLLAALALLTLAACGPDSAGTGDTASDPGSDPSVAVPDAVPAASGPVRSRTLAMVMDTGTPELCLGPVAESWPPQCRGPAIVGWDWRETGRGMFERQGDVRWGQFAVTGTWDGTAFTVTDAIPAALYDPMVPEEPTYPPPARDLSDAELEDISAHLGETVPGILSAGGSDGRVLADVLYDDGTLQDFVDARYGENVVIVVPALVDVDAT